MKTTNDVFDQQSFETTLYYMLENKKRLTDTSSKEGKIDIESYVNKILKDIDNDNFEKDNSYTPQKINQYMFSYVQIIILILDETSKRHNKEKYIRLIKTSINTEEALLILFLSIYNKELKQAIINSGITFKEYFSDSRIKKTSNLYTWCKSYYINEITNTDII